MISALAPTKALVAADLAGSMDRNSFYLYLSVITIAEIEDMMAKLRSESAAQKAGRLSAWLETVRHLHHESILPLDIAAARRLGRLSGQARGAGQAPGLADLAIAAIAHEKGFVVVTCNLRHFGPLDVAAHDPFTSMPSDPQSPKTLMPDA